MVAKPLLNNYIWHAPEIIIGFIVFLSLSLIYKKNTLIVIVVIAFLCCVLFYRGWSGVPETQQANVIMSACEGKVLKIMELEDQLQISVFLNIHNIHVQYIPIDGIVKSIYYKEGELNPAYLFEKSQLNERIETMIGTKYGDIKVVQIAGLIARRALSFLVPGTRVYRGEPMGLIKFGSRVDVYLPLHRVGNIYIKEGDNIHIGDSMVSLM